VQIRRVLIANRGEIAVRIIRTCRRLGIETVLVASEADRDALPAKLADRTLCIGPPRAADSYLKVEAIVQAALGVAADAIHPGYGFLSERSALAKLCEERGIIFIGPTAAQLEAVGDKLRARSEAEAADVPVVPGGPVDSVEAAMRIARDIGAPLLVKAVGGGGGRGMKAVECVQELPAAMELAASEAGAAFGDSRLYLERFIDHGRHVEVQVRYQKLLEEAPAPVLSDQLRQSLHDSAVRFAKRLNYRGAGTVEFLLDRQQHEAFYFLEMNARIQVEHPVTEAVTGVDLVAEQIAIAEGAGLRLTQPEIRLRGCAMECRVNAEDPARDFHPSPGLVSEARWPTGPGVRVDTYIASGSQVPPFYDSLMAKIIVSAPDRGSTLERMRQAIADTRVSGVVTNLAFHAAILADSEFQAGGVDTGFVGRLLSRGAAKASGGNHG
jgi:acetyl-CoA carboxylase biotin carboxylase subunit